ncbi:MULTISPECIES: OmpA family protein [unclassified Acidovorax]|uniref:OmpA family protein n=1 Tax=unclassified Acidovorax TaxID=2684926 RepID=UPI001C45542E|nr:MULTISPECIES: OmpA family protein [unclassified Acidovorax]MBV7461753.1 OmpA family protein [Acidovorax sp. sif0632]MBV7466873.1 OmpA family protein [Acidovorax sp. sif0613]
MSSSDDDSQQRFALGFLFALIALVISVVVGTVVVKRVGTSGAAKPAETALADSAPAALVVVEEASVRVEDGVVKFYFATAKAELAPGADEVLADVVKGVAEGKKAVISGFHDATGDAVLNAELAKQRAFAVRDALKALGVAEDKIELKKPEETTATGSNAEARRVEVALGA